MILIVSKAFNCSVLAGLPECQGQKWKPSSHRALWLQTLLLS